MNTQNPQQAAAPTQGSARAELPAPINQTPETPRAENASLVTREAGSVVTQHVQITYRVDGSRARTTHAVIPVKQLRVGTLINVRHMVLVNGVETPHMQAYVTRQTMSVRTYKTETAGSLRVEGYFAYAVRSIRVDDNGIPSIEYVGSTIVDNSRPTVSSHEEAYAVWIPIEDIQTYNSTFTVQFPKRQTTAGTVARALFA